MTIPQAIVWLDDKKPNGYSQEDKETWIQEVESMAERLRAHYGGSEESSGDTLSLPPPYDGAYLRYMEAQIDYCNGEYGKYNNAMELFNTLWQAYAAFYCRTHPAKAVRARYF